MTVGFVTNPLHVEHAIQDHPEGPERVQAVLALLEECRLLDRLERIEPREATDEELAWAHRPELIEALRRASSEGGGWADMDTYVLPRSCAAAWQAAGACLAATEAVLSGRVRSAFCAVRPPGHHARPAQAMGFCMLNNVAVAARFARRRHARLPGGQGLERVAIVDIDVHHGNGTQDIFYADPHVLYVSTHQYPYYPGTGRAQETGADDGEGATVNIPLPAGCGDAEYRDAFELVVEPLVRRFRPQLILVSCGFDGHFAERMAGMALSVAGYGELAERLQTLAEELCDGRLIFVLEGGYELTAVSWGVRRVLEVLLGETPAPPDGGPLRASASGPDPLGTPGELQRPPDIEGLLADVRGIHGLG